MITDKPNMGREQIFSELPLPSKVKEVTLELIYKALFIIVKLLLDSRLNLVKISEGKSIQTKHQKFKQGGSRGQKPETKKPENGIRGLDSIKIEDKGTGSAEQPDTLTKSKDNVTPTTEKKEDIPSSRQKPDQIKLGEDIKPEIDSGEKSTEQGEKIDEDTNKPKEEK